MSTHASAAYMHASAAVCEAVLRLRGPALWEELGRIASDLMQAPHGKFIPSDLTPGGLPPVHSGPVESAAGGLMQDVVRDSQYFGSFHVCGRGSFEEHEKQQFSSLATLTASLLQIHSVAQRSTHAFVQVEAQLAHQTQILDHLHESVVTMDLNGYITSWNKGAERLFGYSAIEAVGRHILFLYEDEDTAFRDNFAEYGGRMMEVRRRKKNGEVFWASLSLSQLCDLEERPIGMIAYLTDITERKQAEERLHHLAYYDALTGLPNRTLLTKLVDQGLSVTLRNQSIAGVLFIDLNRFKVINDTLGRSVGDELLKEVARRFRAVLREQDVVARLTGDEFAVGLFDLGQHFEATTVAQKLQASLIDPILVDGHVLRVGASIGISVFPQDGTDAESLLRQADIAMARAKADAENPDDSVAYYSQDMNQTMLERMRLEHGLRHALGHGELLLHYQPKYAVDTGRIIGAEALVRWRHAERGLVPPAEFIPLAESTGLVVQVGEWVLETACAQAAAWQRAGLRPFRLAVNVSAREFTSMLPGRVKNTLERYELDPAWLELEITESTLMHNIERVITIMDRLTAMGVALSLDDFGTGYSSLSYLKRFPIHTLKIDRSFTTGIPNDSNDCAIASTIINMGRQLKHRVIAEGVETQEQLNFLRESGCDEVQGYLLSRPLDARAFEKLLRENQDADQADGVYV
ncbi:bifunctional diguanylate cyclase/phosphodiesterase [Massilia sp. TS11]|uniref:putative bifunctional diguanylate cyclase/phosphodiesterase n=1 Tax=Massilia sp. TS11 TaxID=2908003 RepID=UPI001ED9CC58|nr:EAL domain-containing protein [Massilia sp. TS11]MCG2586118.1 EAL domain-containing protein [Massilia sp. TS11]